MKFISTQNIPGLVHACLLAVLLSGCATKLPDNDVPPPAEIVEPAAEIITNAPVEEIVEPAVSPVEQPVYKRDDVVWIQQRLQELGYYNDAIDGAAGAATYRAIRAYQRDQGLDDTGQPTAKLREFIWRNGG